MAPHKGLPLKRTRTFAANEAKGGSQIVSDSIAEIVEQDRDGSDSRNSS